MKSKDKNSTIIMVLFVLVHFLALSSLVDSFMLLIFEPKGYTDYYHLNMSLVSNYSRTVLLNWNGSAFPYLMIYCVFYAVDILPAVFGIIGAAKEKKNLTRVSIVIMDFVCVLTLLTRFTNWGMPTRWGYDGSKLTADFVIILICVIVLNVLIFTKQYVTQTVAQPSASAQPSRWYCHICGAENSLSNTCFKCGGIRANASPYSQPTYATPEKKSASKFDEIKAYKELLDSGAITQEEFDKLKAEILER